MAYYTGFLGSKGNQISTHPSTQNLCLQKSRNSSDHMGDVCRDQSCTSAIQHQDTTKLSRNHQTIQGTFALYKMVSTRPQKHSITWATRCNCCDCNTCMTHVTNRTPRPTSTQTRLSRWWRLRWCPNRRKHQQSRSHWHILRTQLVPKLCRC